VELPLQTRSLGVGLMARFAVYGADVATALNFTSKRSNLGDRRIKITKVARKEMNNVGAHGSSTYDYCQA
jgi:hypothetical protein